MLHLLSSPTLVCSWLYSHLHTSRLPGCHAKKQEPGASYLLLDRRNTYMQAQSEQSSFARGHLPKVQGAPLPYTLYRAVDFGTSVSAYGNGSAVDQSISVTLLQQSPLYDQHPSYLLSNHAQSTPLWLNCPAASRRGNMSRWYWRTKLNVLS